MKRITSATSTATSCDFNKIDELGIYRSPGEIFHNFNKILTYCNVYNSIIALRLGVIKEGKIMVKFQLTLRIFGLFLGGLAAVSAESDKVTSQNSVQAEITQDGVGERGAGNDFVIQEDLPDFPETLPGVTKSLENRFVPPPKVYAPPSSSSNPSGPAMSF